MERKRRILAFRLLLPLKAPCTPPTRPARPLFQPPLPVPHRAAGPPRRPPPPQPPHTSPPPPPPPAPGTLPHDAHVQHRNHRHHSGHRAPPTPPKHTPAAATAAAASQLPTPFPTAHPGCRHRRRHGLIPTLRTRPVSLPPVPLPRHRRGRIPTLPPSPVLLPPKPLPRPSPPPACGRGKKGESRTLKRQRVWKQRRREQIPENHTDSTKEKDLKGQPTERT